ncbi:MAG: MotA/TolQ/ExbB proton channel family protein [Verrucomicrobiae bacterium]|nr:MotA/TolQ/ExbB proton channel family protein [Verrucomicrobiae bacterium]
MEILNKGGVLLWLLLLLGSVPSLGIFIERILFYHRTQINTEQFMKGIRNVLQRGSLTEAISICDETPGPVAQVVKVAILKHDRPREEIRETIEDVGLVEVPRLEKYLVALATIAHVAPLVGLLGTVIGMIRCFQFITEKGQPVLAGDVSAGVWQALLCTAGGLIVAIPAYIAYNYLVSRVDSIVLDMEKCATEMVNYFAARDAVEPQKPVDESSPV